MNNQKLYDKVFRYYVNPELFYSEFSDRCGDYWVDYLTLYEKHYDLFVSMVVEGYSKELILLHDKEIDYVAISPDY